MIQKKMKCIMEIDIIHGTITDFHGTQHQDIVLNLMIRVKNIAI